jgi:hypothetical protein
MWDGNHTSVWFVDTSGRFLQAGAGCGATAEHLCLRATALMQIKIQPFVKLIARADEVIE